MKRFIIQSTILTLIVFLLGGIVYSTVLKSFYLSILPFTVAFFYVVTNLVHGYLLRIADKSSVRFSSQYMAISFLKMFFYLAVAVLFVILDRVNAKIFVANFLLLYILYTSFEVYEFSKVVRQKSK
jgi:hypothetical protein